MENEKLVVQLTTPPGDQIRVEVARDKEVRGFVRFLFFLKRQVVMPGPLVVRVHVLQYMGPDPFKPGEHLKRALPIIEMPLDVALAHGLLHDGLERWVLMIETKGGAQCSTN